MSHAHRAVTVQGVVDVLADFGVLKDVLAGVSAPTRLALEYPHGDRFHPGQVLDETFTVLAGLRGTGHVEQVMYRATERALAGLAAPLARIYLVLVGGGPHALLARFGTLIDVGARGFKAKWDRLQPQAGVLCVTTEQVTPPVADHVWKGTVDFLLAFTKERGEVKILLREHEGHTVRLQVQWGVATQPEGHAEGAAG